MQRDKHLPTPNRLRRVLVVVTLGITLFCLALTGSALADSLTLRAALTGEAEVPGPGDPDGTGNAQLRFFPATNEICYTIKVEAIMLPATGAHVHDGDSSISGPVVVALTPPNARGVSTGCVVVEQTLFKDIYKHPAEYYVNVHTSDYPAGAIRGQLALP